MDNRYEETKAETSPASSFVPPRHWIGPEELEASYWSDPQVREKRGQEFHDKPIEVIDQIDRMDKGGFVRREFLTIMGASMAMSTLACARRPVHKIIPYVVKPEEIVPGVSNWYASTCGECASACGILTKNREGRPIKLEGNPDHPMNQGSLCARGQGSLLNLYDPERLKNPRSRNRSGGVSKDSTWEEVDTEIKARLKTLAAGSGRVRVLSGDISGESTRKLIQDFLSSFKQGAHVEYEPLFLEELVQAQELSYGSSVVPHYRFDEADYVLSLGADFLGTWLSPVEHSKNWSKGRKLAHQDPAHAKLSKLICFESMISVTGSNADERFPVRPGDELKVALALVHELVISQKKATGGAGAQTLLEGYSAEKVSHELGLHEGKALFKRLAEELWAHRGKSLVVGGGLSSKTQDALALQVAVNWLNSLLGNEGSTVDGTLNSSQSKSSFVALSKLLGEMKAGQVDALIIYRSNPAYTTPRGALALEEAFKRVPLVISISDREDETGLLADYILPDHHYLENWGDAHPRKNLYSLQQPAIAPLHSTRAFQDTLLAWSKALGSGKTSLQAKDWHDYLKNNWKETLYRESGAAAAFDQFWDGVLRAGVLDLQSSKRSLSAKPSARTFKSGSLDLLPKNTAHESEVVLALYPKVSMGDGRSANNAWMQEMPDPLSSVTWDNYVNVSPALAKKWGIKSDDVIEIKAAGVIAELPVYVQPGLHPQVAAVAVGYGRRNVGQVGNQAGIDVFPFVQASRNHLVYSGQPVSLRKTGKFYKLASTQWHTATEDRPIINDITLGQFRKNPATANHTDPHLRTETPSMWPSHSYKTYRWGMSIDLNSCTGCGACVIACQAENNIPVVGRDQVRVSRQMHWMKIDRYYSGSAENPDVIFQPMLCQHCENAPCETVCPVLATVHDDEGLNVQVYNRCVGTRYCQNNCPYKVRRFNFFDHWKTYQDEMNLVWNPDVSVRTRGVMEKCTFCNHRIRDAREKAKNAGEKIKDGSFQTACQQTCPTQAISFGDINDPVSQVSQLKESPQAFRVLEVLNTKPSVSYLSKVRNKESNAHSEKSHEGAEHA